MEFNGIKYLRSQKNSRSHYLIELLMIEEYPLITSLENKIDELHQNRSIARKIVDSNSKLLLVNTAIEEYIALKQDLAIPLGIRYLSLSCIAAHYQLYQDNRDYYSHLFLKIESVVRRSPSRIDLVIVSQES